MNATTQLLIEAGDRLASEMLGRAERDESERLGWSPTLWEAYADAGWTGFAESESRGGLGLELPAQLALVRRLGYHAVPLPLVEAAVAERALARAGLGCASGLVTAADPSLPSTLRLERGGSGWTATGTLRRVPWGRKADAIIAVAHSPDGKRLVRLTGPSAVVTALNHAAEPRDDLLFESTPIAVEDVASPDPSQCADEELMLDGSLFRTAQMVGAMERMQERTIDYAQQRIQFGRPIAKFQAVQHQIAILATQVAAAAAALDGAAEARARGRAVFEVGAAKVRASDAALAAIEYAHQVHGAIGFTRDHDLHFSTRRLWSWREDFGTDALWARKVGHAMAAVGGEALWALITAADKQLAFDGRVAAVTPS